LKCAKTIKVSEASLMFWVWLFATLALVAFCGIFVAAVLTMAKGAGADQEQDDGEDWFT
jgi:hypothetical protein